ncbi:MULTISPECIES: hypothetical protein [Okeania]|nr:MULTISPECIES: hypothetical protein [Okeania]
MHDNWIWYLGFAYGKSFGRSQETGEKGRERGGSSKNYPLIFLP